MRVRPWARRGRVGGLSADGTALRVPAPEPPEAGPAHGAVCPAAALAHGAPAPSARLSPGAGGRQKPLRIAGDPDRLAVRIAALAELE